MYNGWKWWNVYLGKKSYNFIANNHLSKLEKMFIKMWFHFILHQKTLVQWQTLTIATYLS
jgi:hypothetical protein